MIIDTKKLWENVLVNVELSVSKATFSTWFKETYIEKVEEGVVFLSVPNAFVRDWIQNKFHKSVLKSLRDLAENIRSLEYVVTKDGSKRKDEQKNYVVAQHSELPFQQEHYINTDDNLNPRYTFESFVVGPFNELAHAAAQAIIKSPGKAYNPLFIHGNTGHGKTHLIQAIGNELKKQGKKVYYISSEKFTFEYVSSVQNAKINQFKEKYRKYDVFIMDDIQFLSKKEKTQEELFHIYNVMTETGKQIIFSSDQHPNFISDIEDRLKSRFSAGMIVDIPPPDNESRIAILKAKSQLSGYTLGDDVLYFLSESIEGNVRELEGVLNTILCQTQLKNRELSLPEIKNLIKHNIKPKKMVSPKEVIKIVSNFYNIEENSIYEKTRKKEVVKPRQVIMYILREDFSVSYPSIGQKLGGRDHTTVMHSCDKIKNEIKDDPNLLQEINQIRALL